MPGVQAQTGGTADSESRASEGRGRITGHAGNGEGRATETQTGKGGTRERTANAQVRRAD
ncbi:hypothetical protein B0H10DRAFT_2108873 [Mycena sp. CBHHK59/15]|nr:hypothetical protein B0H10DRAFT_2108873 [Mycena sp. CBHHK59/15]